MKIPSSINILGDKYKVKLIKSGKLEQGSIAGLCDNEKKIIYIHHDQSDEQKARVFIHEVIHAAMSIVGTDQVQNDNECEVWAQSVASTIYQIARQLKWIK